MAVINKTETKELGLSKKTRNSQITFENTGRVVGVLFRRLQAIQQPTKSDVDKEQVSDAVSCLEDDTCALPDLNLDLTMSFHSPSAPDVEGNPKDSRPQLDTAPSPTLLLFQ
ncbi:hypothetical protein OIU76_013835 [Salix suchowensis]|nr:hypothetical protein OIU76_013835 [Salix suchowensis]